MFIDGRKIVLENIGDGERATCVWSLWSMVKLMGNKKRARPGCRKTNGITKKGGGRKGSKDARCGRQQQAEGSKTVT